MVQDFAYTIECHKRLLPIPTIYIIKILWTFLKSPYELKDKQQERGIVLFVL